MTHSKEEPLFKELNDGTIFMAQQIWLNEDTGLLESASGAWEWEQAAAVLTAVEPTQFPMVEGPTCSILWAGNHLHIRAEFRQVLEAYLRYKKRYGGQYIRLLAN
ncbi:hypothetical protein [Hymenobacter sp. YC55]|uniref:hypothetical protein n=1 Tax=Hymenobacter sp. YC55 TaxID=3034019 RepID=UPI0023F73718|nr:hypothetical protein [Hymenobacter sp. YC55]MDF7810706.1 hypothetical protein [Hymenobacter sp. YC55]